MLNSKKLLGRMVERGYSQKSLAKAIGISDNTMTSRIKLRSSFNTDEIDNICDVLGITDNSEKVEIFLCNSSHIRDENVIL